MGKKRKHQHHEPEQEDEQQQAQQQEEEQPGDGGGAGSSGAARAAAGGSRIDPDTLSYLTEVSQHLSSVSDAEEAALLRANVLEELAGSELRVACDAVSSRLLEQLLAGAPASQLLQFMQAFTNEDQLFDLAGSAFGSHVAEKVLAGLHQQADALAGEELDALDALLGGMVGAIGSHLYDYIMDKHATHVARALLVVITGRDVLTPVAKKHQQQQQQQQAPPGGDDGEQPPGGQQQQTQPAFGRPRSSLREKLVGSAAAAAEAAAAGSGGAGGGGGLAPRFPKLLRQFAKMLPVYDPPAMAVLGKDSHSSPFLQAVLRAAAPDEDLLLLVLPPVLGVESAKAAAAEPGARLASLTDSHVGRLLRDDCYSHLLEVAVAVMPQGACGSIGDEFFDRFLRGRLLPLSSHHCANFVIQAALSAVASGARVSAVLAELGGHLSDLLRRRRSGVVAALVAAAARAGPGPHQPALVAALAAALGQLPQWQGAQGTRHLAPALMTLDTAAVLGGTSSSAAAAAAASGSARLSTPGCAILATLLSQFPRSVVLQFACSVAQLSHADAVRAARDPAGSRALQALLAGAGGAGAGQSSSQRRKLKKKQRRQQQEGGAAGADAAGGEGEGEGADAAAADDAPAQLLGKLAGGWADIALQPAGSFFLEAAFTGASPEQQESIVSEVAASHARLLSGCRWGPLLSSKLGLEAYLRSPDEWRKRASSAAATRRAFEQLLRSDDAAPAPAAAAAGGAAAPGGGPGKQHKKRPRSPAEEEQQQVDGDTRAPAAEPSGGGSSKKERKRARRLAAAAAVANGGEAGRSAAPAANGMAGSEPAAAQQQQQQGKAKKRRRAEEAQAQEQQAAEHEPPPATKKSKHKRKAGAAAAAEAAAAPAPAAAGGKRKRRSSPPPGGGGGGAAGPGPGADVLGLLAFGGLAGDTQHKHKKKQQQHG